LIFDATEEVCIVRIPSTKTADTLKVCSSGRSTTAIDPECCPESKQKSAYIQTRRNCLVITFGVVHCYCSSKIATLLRSCQRHLCPIERRLLVRLLAVTPGGSVRVLSRRLCSQRTCRLLAVGVAMVVSLEFGQ
jgi:hypothetical protein